MSDVVLTLSQISKSYNGVVALQPTDLTVRSGDVIVLIGASGSGKSTLLRCVNMLAIPDSGTVTLAGTELNKDGARARASRKMSAEMSRQRTKMGMVFQSFAEYVRLRLCLYQGAECIPDEPFGLFRLYLFYNDRTRLVSRAPSSSVYTTEHARHS
jgi:ABC-type histidine transport system ATPase subunit